MDNLHTRWSGLFRLLALVLAVALIVMVAAPAKAEADVLATIGIATLVIAGVILIAYLVISNVDESRRGAEGQVIWLACAGADCAAAAARAAQAVAPVAPIVPAESP